MPNISKSNGGFSEAQSAFIGQEADAYVGQVRRFGPHGPAYEAMAIRRSGDIAITVIESSEQLDYPLADFLADPMAETVP